MSKAAEKWAKEQGLRGFEHVVLMALSRHYSPRWGSSKATQKSLSDETGICRETVNRVLRRIENKGKIACIPAPRVKGRWAECTYLLNPHAGGIKHPEKRHHRVTQSHTAPCDSHQTRYRVTQDHTSRGDTTRARSSRVINFPRQTAGGCK